MATTFPETQAIPEGSSRKYTATLLGLDGLPLQSGQIVSIKFSLRDARSGQVINGRNRVEVRNANGGSLTTAGVFSQVLGPADTITIGTARLQKRRAIFEVVFQDGVENHEVFFYVANLADIPYPALASLTETVRLSDLAGATVV